MDAMAPASLALPGLVATLLQREGASQYFHLEGSRICCSLNGHCFPLSSVSALEAFVRCAPRPRASRHLCEQALTVSSVPLFTFLWNVMASEARDSALQTPRKGADGQLVAAGRCPGAGQT